MKLKETTSQSVLISTERVGNKEVVEREKWMETNNPSGPRKSRKKDEKGGLCRTNKNAGIKLCQQMHTGL